MSPAGHRGRRNACQLQGCLPDPHRGVAGQIRQILVNLVGNAVKFTQSGSVRLAVSLLPNGSGSRAGQHGNPSPALQFDVVDTGIGLSQEQMANLFQPFTQADVSTTRKYGGSGLGLAISKRLAALLGGDIEVTSQPGRGSTFRATIATGPIEGVRMLTSLAPAETTDPGTPPSPSPAAKASSRPSPKPWPRPGWRSPPLWSDRDGPAPRPIAGSRVDRHHGRDEPLATVRSGSKSPPPRSSRFRGQDGTRRQTKVSSTQRNQTRPHLASCLAVPGLGKAILISLPPCRPAPALWLDRIQRWPRRCSAPPGRQTSAGR